MAPHIYEGSWDSNSIDAFLEDALMPEVLEFQEAYVDLVFGRKKPTVFYFRNKKRQGDVSTMIDLFKETSMKLKQDSD